MQFIVLLFTTLMASSFFAPVVGGVLWRRANKQGALAAMISGISAAALWRLFGPEALDPVVPGFIVSAVSFVGVSLLAPPPPLEAVEPVFGGR